MNPSCARCSKNGAFVQMYVCTRCRQVYYCSSACQKDHWKNGHKGQCQVLSQASPKEFIQSDSIQTNPVPSSSSSVPVKQIKRLEEGKQQFATREEIPLNDYLFSSKRMQQMINFRGNKMQVGVGLYNAGNTCYLNSVLQCLTFTAPLVNYLESGDHSTNCPKKDFCMLCELYSHIKQVFHPDTPDSIFPRSIFLNINKIGDFTFFQQEDAHDFVYSVLGTMQKNFLATIKRKIDPKLEETSPIYQIFGGYFQNQIKCNVCSSIYTNFESFLDLSLELSAGNSVEEAIQSFTNIEYMDESVGWKCSKCEKPVSCQKQITINQTPAILTITLKRFDFLKGGGKINKSVTFRDSLNLSSVMSLGSKDQLVNYDLYGVIVHYGPSVLSGHYTAFVKVDDIWYLCDDTRVVQVSLSTVLKQNAYILFYQKNSEGKQQKAQTTQKSNKKEEKEEKDLDISTTSQQTKRKIATPIHHIYPRENIEGENSMLQDFVVTIEVPLLMNVKTIELKVSSNGSVEFVVPDLYSLSLTLPFPLVSEKSSGSFYQIDGLLVLILPIKNESSEPAIEKKIEVKSIHNEKFLSSSLKLDAEHEFILETKPTAPPSLNETKKKKKLKEEANEEVASYEKLYQDLIDERNNSFSSVPSYSLNSSNKTKKSQKIGRNDNCPCGSGKKYKLCHGKK